VWVNFKPLPRNLANFPELDVSSKQDRWGRDENTFSSRQKRSMFHHVIPDVDIEIAWRRLMRIFTPDDQTLPDHSLAS